MVQIQVTGPSHSGKGYIMVEIARRLRELGCDVRLQGEETHLAEKVAVSDEVAAAKLTGQQVTITELQT
jgi:molybdopterin-guanine dinucleotide biosynthesis protein